VIFVPAENFFGQASFAYTMRDNGLTNGTADALESVGTVTFDVLAVNDAPSFTKGDDVEVTDGSGPRQYPQWATGIAAGPGETQSRSFSVTTDNDGLFASGPSIDVDGTLKFTPKPNVRGTALVTVRLKDDGGTESGGIDESVGQVFAIEVLKLRPKNNAAKAEDVNDDGSRAAEDALSIVNFINGFGPQTILESDPVGPVFYDVTADNSIAPDDALKVINYINTFGAGEAEGPECVMQNAECGVGAVGESGRGGEREREQVLLELLAINLVAAGRRRK
jgi:hypothetical protein